MASAPSAIPDLPRRAAQLITGATLLADAAVNIRNLGAIFLGISLGASPLWLGLIYAAFAGGFAVCSLLLGGLSDGWGRKRSALTGLAVSFASVVALFYCHQPGQVALASLVFGASMALLWPSVEAWVCDLSGGDSARLNRLLGNFNLSWSSGLALGALLGGVLWQALAGHTFLAVLGLLVLVMALLSRVPEGRHLCPPAEQAPPGADPDPTGRFLLAARLTNFLGWFTTAVVLTILPKLAQELGIAPGPTGVAVGAYYAALWLLMWLGRGTDRWQYRIWPLVVPVPLVMVGAALLASAHSWPAFAGAAFVAGTCCGVSSVTSLFYALNGRHQGRAASAAVHETIVASAGIAGGLVTGAVADALAGPLGLQGGLRGSLLVILAVAVLLGLTQIVAWRVLGRRTPIRAPSPEPALPAPAGPPQ